MVVVAVVGTVTAAMVVEAVEAAAGTVDMVVGHLGIRLLEALSQFLRKAKV